jgi:threonine/homoserine/homoserine lactone efflux protein
MLPQFIPSGAPVALYTVALIGLQAVCAILWYLTVALIARRGQRWLRKERVQRWVSRTTATVFTVFGIRTALLDP